MAISNMEFAYNDQKELLRLATAGSVDDGKSTLIGRLLYETDNVYQDQLDAVKKASEQHGGNGIDFSLLTDGLAAEREQKITIDVAYRYFATHKRQFIIADVPGHEQYTKNMVTGASTANVVVILVDAARGFQTQSKRHLFLSTLLGVPHIVIAINKMDLVSYDEQRFEQLRREIADFAAKLNAKDLQFIPVSALAGDMIVSRSANMPWYGGYTLLDYLENLYIGSDRNLIDFRFPVQYVLRPDANFRGYAGQIRGGTAAVGDDITVLPSGKQSKIKQIIYNNNDQKYGFNPQSVLMVLENEIDASRGDMIVRTGNKPDMSREIDTMLVWMSDEQLEPNTSVIIKHTTKQMRAVVKEIKYTIDINTLHRKLNTPLGTHDVGRVVIQSTEPILYDSYEKNKHTGSFILIDEFSKNTVGAGMMLRGVQHFDDLPEHV